MLSFLFFFWKRSQIELFGARRLRANNSLQRGSWSLRKEIVFTMSPLTLFQLDVLSLSPPPPHPPSSIWTTNVVCLLCKKEFRSTMSATWLKNWNWQAIWNVIFTQNNQSQQLCDIELHEKSTFRVVQLSVSFLRCCCCGQSPPKATHLISSIDRMGD